MSKELKDRFFQQYPKGCPNCQGPKRFITVRELSGSFGRGGPENGGSSSKNISRAGTIVPTLYLLTRGKHAFFAECERCNEAWVWREKTGEWVNTREIQKLRRAKVVTPERGEDHSQEDRIGRLY